MRSLKQIVWHALFMSLNKKAWVELDDLENEVVNKYGVSRISFYRWLKSYVKVGVIEKRKEGKYSHYRLREIRR